VPHLGVNTLGRKSRLETFFDGDVHDGLLQPSKPLRNVHIRRDALAPGILLLVPSAGNYVDPHAPAGELELVYGNLALRVCGDHVGQGASEGREEILTVAHGGYVRMCIGGYRSDGPVHGLDVVALEFILDSDAGAGGDICCKLRQPLPDATTVQHSPQNRVRFTFGAICHAEQSEDTVLKVK